MGNSTDVIIIGGGVIGCSAAFFLSKRGAKVRLFDKDGIASHSSGFAFGSLSAADSLVQKPERGLLNASFLLHKELAETLPELSGLDYGFIQKSTALLTFSEAEAQSVRSKLGNVSHCSKVTAPEWVTAEGVRDIEPRVSHKCVGGLIFNQSYQIDPYRFTLSLWYGAMSYGAQISRTTVSEIVFEKGRAVGVKADGEILYSDAVILAAGAWSSKFLENVGINLKVEPLKGQILRIRIDEKPLPLTFSFGKNYVSSKPDGLVWAGTTEERVGFDDSPSSEGAKEIMMAAESAFPYVGNGNLVKHTACLRPVTADLLPVVGAFSSVERLFVATGAGRKGVSMGPGMGMAVTDIVMGGSTDVPVQDLSPSRFSC